MLERYIDWLKGLRSVVEDEHGAVSSLNHVMKYQHQITALEHAKLTIRKGHWDEDAKMPFSDDSVLISPNIIICLKIKLLGYAELIGKSIYQRVHPTLIKKSSYVASIDGVLNAVIIDGKPVGQSIIQGEGAGPAATTSALISDISSILRGNIKFPFSVSSKERKKLKFQFEELKSIDSFMEKIIKIRK